MPDVVNHLILKDVRDYDRDLDQCKTSYDVFRVLKEVTSKYEYSKFLLLHLPNEIDSKFSEMVIITNWDSELIGAFEAIAPIFHSPAIKAMKDSTLPYIWQSKAKNRINNETKNLKVRQLFENFNIFSGVYFPVTDKNLKKGGLGFSGNRPKPNKSELMELNYLANHTYEMISNINIETKVIKNPLTKRELECIYWTAAGKTSSDIAVILSISENTVNNYITAAAHKLNTVNKAHTVAKAIRTGLLEKI